MARSTGGLEYFELFSKPLYDVMNALAASVSETPFRPSFALILFAVEFAFFICVPPFLASGLPPTPVKFPSASSCRSFYQECRVSGTFTYPVTYERHRPANQT